MREALAQPTLGFMVPRHLKDKDLEGDEYSTQRSVFDPLNARYRFRLDAAAAEWSAKCRMYWTAEEDALTKRWENFGSVWLNPPYSRNLIDRFMDKALETALAGAILVALVFHKSDTQWWARNVRRPRNCGQLLSITPRSDPWGLTFCARYELVTICTTELEGRLEFEHESGGAKETARFPSTVIAYEPPGWKAAA